MCGDPKIVGGDGVVFYFHGRKDQDFCLVSDSDLHINAHFIGKRPDGRQRDFTWVQALGFVFRDHGLTIAANKVAQWDAAVDQLQLTYNGVPFALGATSWASPDGAPYCIINKVMLWNGACYSSSCSFRDCATSLP